MLVMLLYFSIHYYYMYVNHVFAMLNVCKWYVH